MKGLVFRISFFEAFFKCHYTKKYRLSYPIPLPTTIAGILGSILGLKREDLKDYFKDFYFGAKLIETTPVFESTTLIEIANKAERSVEKALILNEPEYEIALVGDNKKIDDIKERLKSYNFYFLPFGGQNDYFLKYLKFICEREIEEKKEAYGYFPIDVVEQVEGKFWILPVKYRNKKVEFVFTKDKAKLKEKVPVVNDIAVYKLKDFSLL